MKIGNIQINGIASLAPMAGVTDRAFREICAQFGCSYFTSEMVSAKGLIYESKKTYNLLSHSPREKPFSIQIFGDSPETISQAAKLIVKEKPDIIDINMGCPAPKITKNGSGSALMRNPHLCAEIVYKVKSIIDIPLTVKIRSGWDEKSVNAVEVSKLCEQAGADCITIHGRTAKQMYSGKVNLDIIKETKKSVNIPVIGNGDIVSAEDALNMINYTKCDMTAIGRGSLGNPWIFSQINSLLLNRQKESAPNIEEKVKIIHQHINKMCLYKGEKLGIIEARKHISWYIKGIKGAASFRKKVCCVETLSELNNICEEIIMEYNF